MNQKQTEAYKKHRHEYYMKRRKEILKKWSEKYWANPDFYRKRQNARIQERIATDPEYREKRKEKNRINYRRNKAWFVLRNAEQAKTLEQKARIKLGFAVRDGRIKKSTKCDACNLECVTEAHHYDGYKDPFKVFWLCRPCHAKIHRK